MEKTPNDNPENYPALGRWLMFVEKKKNVDRLIYVFYAICALLLVADFFYKKKVYFDVEKLTGVYAIYGLILCALIVVGAKILRHCLMRPQDYYADKSVENEDYPQDGLDQESVND